MPNIYKNFAQLVGGTPLFEPINLIQKHGLCGRLLLKLEYFNPAGSVKDRIAAAMIDSAEKNGLLKEGSVIIEPTSGNTGIGLAAAAAAKGYKVILTMPETMSLERRQLLNAYGAEIVLTKNMQSAIDEANRLAAALSSAVILSQFTNPCNVQAHYTSTAPEIWADTDGRVDVFVAGVGTGGTVTGTGRFLKEKNPAVKIIAVEPEDSPVLSKGKAGSHAIQGIGAGFVPPLYDAALVDCIMTVSTGQAFFAAKELVKCEGLLAGISSGAALSAAMQLAKSEEYTGKTIVTVLPDSGEKYLSTPLYNRQ